MPPKSKKGAGGTKKKANNSNNSNNSGNSAGRNATARKKRAAAAKLRAAAPKTTSRKGTLALCLDENKASKELPGNRVILKCVGIKKGLSAVDATVSFRGNGAFEKPSEDYTEFHLCRGKPGKVPKVASRLNIPQKPFKRALYRCYTRGATVEALEKKAEEEFGGENSSPESRYSSSPESTKRKSASPISVAENNNDELPGVAPPANGPSSGTRSKARRRAKSANIYTQRLRVRRGSSVGPGKIAPKKGALQLNAGLLKRLRRMAQPKPPAGPPPQEKVVLSTVVLPARASVGSFLAEGSVAAKRRAFEEEAARIAAEAAALKARSPVPSLKKGASGP
jgi:hypothetical protein